jgi:UDP-N-acetylmuramoyl-tripeptide--D-alanyl-D-alanine ligase
MGEVGNQGPEFHREVGAYAAENEVSKVFALGEQSLFAKNGFNSVKVSANSSAIHFENIENLILHLHQELAAHLASGGQHLNILVKGSRFMRMERVVQALLEEAKTCS